MPDPMQDPCGHGNAVAAIAVATGARVLYPVTDASILSLLPLRSRLRDTVLPVGDSTVFRALSDKRQVWERAREIGIRVPGQHVLGSADDVDVPDLSWPRVVKPARSVVSDGAGAGRREESVSHVSGPDEFAAVRRRLAPGAYPVLLQEKIRGPGIGVFLLRWDDETRAVFGHRRLREKPPSGGVSVYRESLPLASDLLQLSERLLADFGWSGLAMVEYKVEGRTGDPYLMEVNARPWGSLQLAVDAGVDFPRLLVEAVLGGPARPPPEYRSGVRCRWLWGDVDHLIARVKGAVPGDSVSGERPRRLDAIAEFLTWHPGDRLEVLRARDPRPFLRETGDWLRRALELPGPR